MRRDQWIKIRVSTEEKKSFEQKANESGMTMADLIRQRLLTFRIRKTAHEQERIRMLARVGNNINQLARWANSHKSGLEAIQIIMRLDAILQELRKES